jgi:hypothetical protein
MYGLKPDFYRQSASNPINTLQSANQFLIFRVGIVHHCERRQLCSRENVHKEKVLRLLQPSNLTVGTVIGSVRDPRSQGCTSVMESAPNSMTRLRFRFACLFRLGKKLQPATLPHLMIPVLQLF